jgi:integrase
VVEERLLSQVRIARTVPVCEFKDGMGMSIVKRGNSQYWYIQFQLNGKTYIRSSRTANKKVAEQMEVEWKSKVHAQRFLGTREQISLGEAIELFMSTKEGTPNHSNLYAQKQAIARLMNAKKPLDELGLLELERFKRDREAEGIGAQTLKHSFNLVRGAWKHARKLGYATADLDFPQVKLPKYRLRFLSDEEEQRLLKELEPHREVKGLMPYTKRPAALKSSMQDAYDIVILLLDTGARYSEVANIKWSQIFLDQREIHLWRPKVQNETILYMTNRVYDVLKQRAASRGGAVYVFRNKKGGPRGYAGRSIAKGLKRAGLTDCTIHTFRHTLASRLVQNGMSIYEVREILGHTDIKTTMRYAHLEQKHVSAKARDIIDRLSKQRPLQRLNGAR